MEYHFFLNLVLILLVVFYHCRDCRYYHCLFQALTATLVMTISTIWLDRHKVDTMESV